jgi:hypothetical protein
LLVPFHTLQFEGQEVSGPNPDFLDRSITHLVPGYNFSKRFGVSLNVPLVYHSFQRSDIRYAVNGADVFFTERGTESGLGDTALIGRFAVLEFSRMKYGITINVLGGVKLPTGDSERLKDEVEQSQIFAARLPPGTPHDPLGHSRSFVHQHDLALGSGSFDGITGVTMNSHWQRWFFNSQFQYYWRTEGESSFQYGNELMVSGGPGCYVLLIEKFTLSLQANAAYETFARDRLLGQKSDATEMTGWYVGPQILFASGHHLSARVGADLPVRIENNGRQAVADFRFYASVGWRF